MAIVQSGTAATGYGSSARVLTMGSALTAGSTLIVCLYNASGLDTTSATCGGNAMTLDLEYDGGGSNYRHIYRYYSASGGETSCSFEFGGSGTIGYFAYVEDDEIDNADPVDATVAWADSGEFFAVSHQYDITAGVPAAGGLAVALIGNDNPTGTSGTSAQAPASSGMGMLYKAAIASGAVALNCDLSAPANSEGMVISYNYAAAGSSGAPRAMNYRRRRTH